MWDRATDRFTGLTVEDIRRSFLYDPEEGVLRWAERKSKRKYLGPAGYLSTSDGYVYICINGREYLAHRLIWVYMTGKWPVCQIDHEDRNGSNNKWLNLREATNSENGFNKTYQSNNNSTKIKGISRRRGKYRVRISAEGKEHHCGDFDTLEEAIEMRRFMSFSLHGKFGSE